ncbi:MAG TPA: DUF3267 domain-containing protein [Mariniphaga anaerophila]|uniref:DUF3267 domain-containing protein n=1 Tax=Mariniphaga anaerophila TaxID=1484053 RepID=A0A831LW82_9BACT|nr:DUF3267 domain-containing protein [Mariniphaga anaerophila]
MNMTNPTIEELQNSENYELVAELEHRQIKEFVIDQISTESRLIKGFMIYQGIIILVGLFFATRPIVLAMRGNSEPLFYLLGAIIFTFTLLIIIHELLHLLALKITGAPKITIGGYLKKFIFYAEADRHVLNRKQFELVALTPLVVVKAITLVAIVLTIGEPVFYFWMFVMSAHSLFCAGDIGLLSFFDRFPGSEVYTYDLQEEKRSYFFREK